MKKIEEKYQAARPLIKNGDLILFRGRRFLAKSIQYFDKAYYNHIGVIFQSEGHNMIMDSNAQGVKPDFLSDRIRGYIDFCVVSPRKTKDEIDLALETAFQKGDAGTKYDFFLLLRIAIIKKTRIDFSGLGSEKRHICSEFARHYTDCLDIKCYKDVKLITPQDFLRSKDSVEVDVLFDDSQK